MSVGGSWEGRDLLDYERKTSRVIPVVALTPR